MSRENSKEVTVFVRKSWPDYLGPEFKYSDDEERQSMRIEIIGVDEGHETCDSTPEFIGGVWTKLEARAFTLNNENGPDWLLWSPSHTLD